MELRIKRITASNFMDKQVFQFLWNKYIEELRAMDSKVELTENDATDTLNQEDTSVYLIVNDAMTSGFMVVGNKPSNCPDSCDYFIQEFYVTDKYQNKGLGKLVMKQFFSEHEGRYFLYILKKNQKAQHFWKKVVSQNGCEYFEASENIPNYDNTDYLLFKTKG